MTSIYLDYNSTAPPSPSVIDYFRSDFGSLFANPSSEHLLGKAVDEVLKGDRRKIAELLGAEPRQIVFTSGGTESINSVLSGGLIRHLGVEKIVSSQLEHHATLACLKRTEVPVEWIANDGQGQLDLDHLSKVLNASGPALVTLLHVNNETGVVHPISEIAKMVKAHRGFLHVDGVQAPGKVEFTLERLGADFVSLSGHKFGALKGIGVLFVRDRSKFEPLIVGGGQEHGLRAGTTPIDLIRSLRLALEDCRPEVIRQVTELREYFES
ncbi:MAG: aminotransferase class V-fold PLP-dependent enzyme, partial [Bdellovibrionales bacterium]|nr:aminotransferase class V-fold PLP-dependent enzyme [Bdellovibrionales bacterium]